MITKQVVAQMMQSFGLVIRSLIQGTIFAAICSASIALAVVPNAALPAFSSHVTDLAQIMGRDAVDIDSRLKSFEKATGHQVFVLTVKSTGAQSIEEYVVNVFQKWRIGGAGTDNGVLFVIAKDDRRMRIEVGYGLEGLLTDAQCARIIHDIVVPQLEQGRHVAGIRSGVDAILGMLAPAATLDGTRVVPSESRATRLPNPDSANGAIAFVLILSIAIVVGSIWFGLVGLGLVSFFTVALLSASKADANGNVILPSLVTAWLCGRWFLVKSNVRKYHLPHSTSPLLTWFWVFAASGTGRPPGPQERSSITVSFFLSGSDSDERHQGEGRDGGGGGRGGRSGGAGASGRW